MHTHIYIYYTQSVGYSMWGIELLGGALYFLSAFLVGKYDNPKKSCSKFSYCSTSTVI